MFDSEHGNELEDQAFDALSKVVNKPDELRHSPGRIDYLIKNVTEPNGFPDSYSASFKDPDYGQMDITVELLGEKKIGKEFPLRIPMYNESEEKMESAVDMFSNKRVWIRKEGIFGSGPTMECYVQNVDGKWFQATSNKVGYLDPYGRQIDAPQPGVKKNEVWDLKFHHNDEVTDEADIQKLDSLFPQKKTA